MPFFTPWFSCYIEGLGVSSRGLKKIRYLSTFLIEIKKYKTAEQTPVLLGVSNFNKTREGRLSIGSDPGGKLYPLVHMSIEMKIAKTAKER